MMAPISEEKIYASQCYFKCMGKNVWFHGTTKYQKIKRGPWLIIPKLVKQR